MGSGAISIYELTWLLKMEEDMKKYPLKRYGDPLDIAYGIIYFLSDASSWVTGHTLVIDGGRIL